MGVLGAGSLHVAVSSGPTTFPAISVARRKPGGVRGCGCRIIVSNIVRVYVRVHIFLEEKFHSFSKSES